MEQRASVETYNGLQYQVSYRSIKYPRLEFKSGSLVAVLPRSGIVADEFIKKHEKWINDRALIINQALENAKEKKLQRRSIDYRFRDTISSLSLGFCKEFGFNVNNLYLRRMNSKWASYSQKGNLTVNALLKYLPDTLIGYVIFHEVAHSVERAHNKRFWRILGKKFPNYKDLEYDLLIYWFLLKTNNAL
jgi:hypothetical protein